MKRQTVGKLLLTILLVTTALVSDVVDWNEPLPATLAGIPIYPNMAIATIIVSLCILAYWLARKDERNQLSSDAG